MNTERSVNYLQQATVESTQSLRELHANLENSHTQLLSQLALLGEEELKQFQALQNAVSGITQDMNSINVGQVC